MGVKNRILSFSLLLWISFVYLWILAGKVNNIEFSKKEADDKNRVLKNIDYVEPKTWNCEIVKACDDKMGFDAILTLHQRLDDDADGNIDIVESDEFLRDELNYKSGYERQKRFHRNDKQISVDELWFSWKSSEVHNWTVEETIQWLLLYVELPQYSDNFKENFIDGTALPRMAVNNMHFLSNLGIKDPIHKHKISLKAMDVVLFGPSKNHNYLKDAILALSVGLATAGCWFAYIQHKRSQRHLYKTMRDMESLQRAEESLRNLQEELDKAKLEQERATTEKRNLERRLQDEKITSKLKHQDSTVNLDGQTKIQKLEQELRDVIEDLRSAEIALHAKNWFPSPVLQHWLQFTHELELQHYNEKKSAAEKQLFAAKEACEKLRKRRTSFLGAFRVAHGSVINDVDNRILQARTALSEVTKDLQERLSRWKEIEALCGFSIVNNPGLRQLESVLGASINVTTPTSVTPHVARRCSEGTLIDEETGSILDSGVSARSIANFSPFCNQRSGFGVNLGSMRSIPSADLKTVASSNAILQRSNAFIFDSISERSSFDKDNTHFLRENILVETSRPVFIIGESKDASLQNTEYMSLLQSQEDNQAEF